VIVIKKIKLVVDVAQNAVGREKIGIARDRPIRQVSGVQKTLFRSTAERVTVRDGFRLGIEIERD